ncbi:CYFA0S12e02113g1_1 [Cyberlindnera fabianii]|uniref:CYFA0S12e02113g1_1 n=1 Tax=Cyberlindnera fabianii TaxID=36022 RepID=A0A061B2A7_CYBFA|nr:CYFA0S12e02113g1_1 [Cyberlindnera fabianii]
MLKYSITTMDIPITQTVDTLKYITFFHFPRLDAEYVLPGTSTTQMSECEALLGQAIPGDIWDLWSECGGELGTLGIAMGLRMIPWRESIRIVLNNAAHFSDPEDHVDGTLLPLMHDDSIKCHVTVRLHTGEVVVVPETDSCPGHKHSPIGLEVSPGSFLQRLVTSLVNNNGFYEVLPEGKYRVLVGNGSYIRHILAHKFTDDDVAEQLAAQTLT